MQTFSFLAGENKLRNGQFRRELLETDFVKNKTAEKIIL